VTALVAAALAGYGAFLVYTAVVFQWRGVGLGPSVTGSRVRRPAAIARWMAEAGLGDVKPIEFAGVMVVLFLAGCAAAFTLFGGLVPGLVAGSFAASFPIASHRARRSRRLQTARDAWPRMLEEVRILTGSLGRSIPQALLEVGRRGPAELRGAFETAEREWMISTDFGRTTAVLKERMADPTADAACETLLVAHEVGGTDVDRRLAALVEDRIQDLQGRKDAVAKQAGVRFARRFVLVVPLGMAVAGLSIGTGRAAYQTAVGQLLVTSGVVVIAGCWVWASRLMRLPQEERVFG
jgi:tight adherence protein B